MTAECTSKQKNEDSFVKWNPEFIVVKDKINGSNMLCIPIQNNKLLNFKHYKILSMYDIKLNFDRIDTWGIYKYCNGMYTVKQICKIVMSLHNDAMEAAVMEKIEKLVHLGALILIDKK